MGKFNPLKVLSAPKMPTPQVVEQPTLQTTDNQDALLAERKRRAGAVGSTGNIVSSLVGSTSDLGASSKKSTLLGG